MGIVTAPTLPQRYRHRPRHAAAPTARWPFRATLTLAVAVFAVAFVAGIAAQAYGGRPAGHIRPMIDTSTQGEQTMSGMPMRLAQKRLDDAIKDLERLRSTLTGANAGPAGDAHKNVSSVFRAGYNLPKVNVALGQIEGLKNGIEALVGRVGGVINSIREAKG